MGCATGTNGRAEHFIPGIHASGGSMRKVLGLVVVAGALMVSACNTVEGVGKDVSSAGSTVAKTADDAK
jgi:predicted small secreted protein